MPVGPLCATLDLLAVCSQLTESSLLYGRSRVQHRPLGASTGVCNVRDGKTAARKECRGRPRSFNIRELEVSPLIALWYSEPALKGIEADRLYQPDTS